MVGTLFLVGFAVAALLEARRHPADAMQRLAWMLYVLPLPILKFLTAYGICTIKRWGRILGLIFSALYVWVFPFGTLLAVYTWWVLYGESGRHLYSPNSPEELSER